MQRLVPTLQAVVWTSPLSHPNYILTSDVTNLHARFAWRESKMCRAVTAGCRVCCGFDDFYALGDRLKEDAILKRRIGRVVVRVYELRQSSQFCGQWTYCRLSGQVPAGADSSSKVA